jgi:DNA-binding NarL/FixJ family response regulator
LKYHFNPPAGEPNLNLRILIVDDHQVVRRGVESVVLRHSLGMVCGEAENGEEAIRQVRELAPDVVIMDVSMPVMNGLEAARQIRRIAPHVKILVFTMHNASPLMQLIKESGADAVIDKFSAEDQLVQAIRAFNV